MQRHRASVQAKIVLRYLRRGMNIRDSTGRGEDDSILTCTRYLEKIVLLKFLEHTPLNFDKLIGHQKR